MSTRNATFLAVALAAGLVAAPAHGGEVSRMSLTHAGLQSNGTATSATGRAVSADGRLVVFHSNASNMVLNDTNAATDVFVRDRIAATTERVSVSSTGVQANGSCFNPAVAGDGSVVAFESGASTLVEGDTNAVTDVFVRDRASGTTARVSVASDGSQANGASSLAALSRDGRLVVFRSTATNLVADDTNAQSDVFVHDRATGATTRVSVASDGTQGNNASTNPGISADGRLVVFESNATNLVAGDTNGVADVFVHDRLTGATVRASVAAAGGQLSGASTTPVISADGAVVAYRSAATNVVAGDTNFQVDVFAVELATGAVARVSVGTGGTQANGASAMPALSADGRVVVFQSMATNLVAGDTNGQADVFAHDRASGATTRVNLGPGGVQGNGTTSAPSLSDDAVTIAFTSAASNLVADDTATGAEVFAWVPACGDAVADPEEACDDGNLVDGDGCDHNCTPTACGNGVLTAGEDCDDGNLVDGDGCNADCSLLSCGDGRVAPGVETCDDGNLVDGDGCDGNCTPTGCGNGVVTAGEACDDGNLVDGDGCDANCTPTACGNGVVTAGETCDDGNLADGDGCDANCTPTGCGNGVVTAGEACDDGNAVDGDGCDAGCVVSPCTGSVQMTEASVTFQNLGGRPGDERLALRAALPFAPGAPPAWVPARGARVLVEDLGVEDGTLVDLDDGPQSVPPAGCASRREGWRRRGAGRVHVFRGGRSHRADRCRSVAARGVLVVRFADKRARQGTIEVDVVLRNATLAAPVGPLRATVVLGADDGGNAACAARLFATCVAEARGVVTCR